jgi:hypothetical protein
MKIMPTRALSGHAVVRAEGRSQEILEQCLEKKRIRRRAVLETSHFMSLPFILAHTELIATVPHAGLPARRRGAHTLPRKTWKNDGLDCPSTQAVNSLDYRITGVEG